jgi:hypothetical protein
MRKLDPSSTFFAILCREMFSRGLSTMQVAQRLCVLEHQVYNAMARIGE